MVGYNPEDKLRPHTDRYINLEIKNAEYHQQTFSDPLMILRMVGVAGFEPRLPSPEPGALPTALHPEKNSSSKCRAAAVSGWRRRIRTLTNRVRVCRATLTQFSNIICAARRSRECFIIIAKVCAFVNTLFRKNLRLAFFQNPLTKSLP